MPACIVVEFLLERVFSRLALQVGGQRFGQLWGLGQIWPTKAKLSSFEDLVEFALRSISTGEAGCPLPSCQSATCECGGWLRLQQSLPWSMCPTPRLHGSPAGDVLEWSSSPSDPWTRSRPTRAPRRWDTRGWPSCRRPQWLQLCLRRLPSTWGAGGSCRLEIEVQRERFLKPPSVLSFQSLFQPFLQPWWTIPTRLGSRRGSWETGLSGGRHRPCAPPDTLNTLSDSKTLKFGSFYQCLT